MISDIKKWKQKFNLVFLYKENYPLMIIDFYYNTTKKYKKIIGNHHKNFVFLSKKNQVAAYYSNKEMGDSSRISLNFLDSGFLKEHLKNINRLHDRYEDFRKKNLSVGLTKKLSKKQTYKLFREYAELYMELVAYFRSSRPEFSDYLVELLKKELNKAKLSASVLEKAVYYLITPFEDNPIHNEKRDWYFLLKKINPCKEDFFKHINEYPWLFPNTYSETKALNFLESKYIVDSKRKNSIKAELNKFEKQKLEATRYKNNLFTSKELKYSQKLSKVIQGQAKERLLLKVSLMGINYLFRNTLISIANVAESRVDSFMRSYTLNETKDLLLHDIKISDIELKNRRRTYVYLVKNLKKTLFSGIKANIIESELKEKHKQIIQGAVAYKGLVRGIVKIVDIKNLKMLNQFMTDFKSGDVLVTSMTQPNIVPVMSKASAIITDQGGMISHAAIIAREMKKPCIVGTKVATQILKNGDLVEVDANKGTVRII